MPNARILDGKALANRLQAELAQEVQAWSAVTGVKPGLAVVLVGAEPASMVYVRNKRKAAHSAGFEDHLIEMPSDISQQALVDEVEKLNSNPAVHGILVQLPLPKHLDTFRGQRTSHSRVHFDQGQTRGGGGSIEHRR